MRSRILDLLKNNEWVTTSMIVQGVNVTYSTVLYHLKNMQSEEIVEHNSEGAGWRVVPIKQVELTEYLSKKHHTK
jgi:predicted transcriptional regulator